MIAELAVGSTLKHAAAAASVTPRVVQQWRARAYSRDPADQPFVDFERALQRGLLAAAEVGQPRVDAGMKLQPLDELYADLSDVDWLDD